MIARLERVEEPLGAASDAGAARTGARPAGARHQRCYRSVVRFPSRSARSRRGPVSDAASRSATLSVVVPFFNVAAYLPDCLESILAQPVTPTEVLLVDDGSTDGSAEVARRYAEKHPVFRLIQQPNSGVSVARNVAVPQCRGEFLTFVDGDDVLPADAWSAMLGTVIPTGSDFVVGGAERDNGGRRLVTPLMRGNHAVERLGVRLEEMPLMLADVFVWNKIFRRDFWQRERIHFPEHTRYQDQVAMTQAFLAARAFDVLTEVVYVWGVRSDRSSATQRRTGGGQPARAGQHQADDDRPRRGASPRGPEVLYAEVLPIDMGSTSARSPVAARSTGPRSVRRPGGSGTPGPCRSSTRAARPAAVDGLVGHP